MDKEERLIPLPKSQDNPSSRRDDNSYPPVYQDDLSQGRRSIYEYFNVVLKRLPLILTVAVTVTAAVAFYMYRQPSIYEASTKLVIEPRKPRVQQRDSININLGNDPNYMNTQLQLLRNPDLMKAAVIRLGLHRNPDAFSKEEEGIFSSITKLFSKEERKDDRPATLPVISGTATSNLDAESLTDEERERVDRYAAIIANSVEVTQVEKTNLVIVTVQMTNKDLVPKVADMIAELFVERDGQKEQENTKRIYDQITRSIEDLKVTVAQQGQELTNRRKTAKLPVGDGKAINLLLDNLDFVNRSLQAVDQELQKLEAQREAILQTQADSRREGIAVRNGTLFGQSAMGGGQLEGDRQFRNVDTELSRARTELARLRVTMTDENPKVKAKLAEIEGLEKDAMAAQQEQLIAIDAKIKSLKAQQARLNGRFAGAATQATDQGEVEVEITDLARELAQNRELLDSLIQKQKEQELSLGSGVPDNLKIETRAFKPTSPIGPKRNRNIILAFLLVMGAGIGVAFLLDYLDDSVKTSDDVGRYVGLPTLALIPQQAGDSGKRRRLLKSPSASLPQSNALISLKDARSAMAEAFRHLRTSLLFSSAGRAPQAILVTSSQPSEGKTTTAINTAVTLAQAGASVVIIDCDLRRPRLHSHFNLPNTSGLTNFLSGDEIAENLIQSFEGMENLDVITSGPIPPNPAELLSSAEMRNLVEYLRERYDHIIVDSPPAISFTDAAIMSTIVDGVILVAMVGKSSIHMMKKFKQTLSNIGARIFGVVLNGITSDSLEYGYYGYSTYSYYDAPVDDSTPRLEDVLQDEDSTKKNG